MWRRRIAITTKLEQKIDDLFRVWQVLWEEEQLWLYQLRHGRMPLQWMGGDRFYHQQAFYEFRRDGAGKVLGVNCATPRQRHILFARTSE